MAHQGAAITTGGKITPEAAKQAAAIGATIDPKTGGWFINGKHLTRQQADDLTVKAGVGTQTADESSGWLNDTVDRNRNFTGNLLKNVAPLAALIPGVGPLASAGIGALGAGIHKGTNLGDIVKQGAVSGAEGYGAGNVLGAAKGASGVLGTAKAVAGALPGVAKTVQTANGVGGLVAGPGAPPATTAANGGVLGDIGSWLGANALPVAQGINAADLMRQSKDYADRALKTNEQSWNERAGLRTSGVAGLNNPVPIDLSALQKQRLVGNPFALPNTPQPVGG